MYDVTCILCFRLPGKTRLQKLFLDDAENRVMLGNDQEICEWIASQRTGDLDEYQNFLNGEDYVHSSLVNYMELEALFPDFCNQRDLLNRATTGILAVRDIQGAILSLYDVLLVIWYG